MMRRLALLLACLGAANAAQAGLFDDDQARQQVAELKAAVDARSDANARALLELSSQLQALRDEQAKLRGQIETATNGLEQINKRLQDFYVDLDNRLRKLEPQPAGGDASKGSGAASESESKDYEAALNLFKAGKYKEAAAAFTVFVTNHTASPLAPSAQFWLGNAWYAMRDCKRATEAQNQLLAKWPSSPKAPEGMLAIATCQQEQGNAKLARQTLETLVAQYPEAPAADTARQRLKKK